LAIAAAAATAAAFSGAIDEASPEQPLQSAGLSAAKADPGSAVPVFANTIRDE
jgi:hypothetical protein